MLPGLRKQLRATLPFGLRGPTPATIPASSPATTAAAASSLRPHLNKTSTSTWLMGKRTRSTASKERPSYLNSLRPSSSNASPYAADSACFEVRYSTRTRTKTEEPAPKKPKAKGYVPAQAAKKAGSSEHKPVKRKKRNTRGMRDTTRASYLARIQSAYGAGEAKARTDKAEPLLLLLDLNGTLLFRPNRSSSSTKASLNPIHRPYLHSFLLYALGVPSQDEEALARTAAVEYSILHTLTDWPYRHNDEREKSALAKLDAIHANFSRLSVKPNASGSKSPTTATGHDDGRARRASRDLDTHPYGPWTPCPPGSGTSTAAGTASTDPLVNLIIWSSAKPENVHRMARSIFVPTWKESDGSWQPSSASSPSSRSPSQTPLALFTGAPPASQSSVALLARIINIWARDTLIPIDDPAYSMKVPCLKDLDIVWYALNTEGPKAQPPSSHRGGRFGQISTWRSERSSGPSASSSADRTSGSGNRLSALERRQQDTASSDAQALDWEPERDPKTGRLQLPDALRSSPPRPTSIRLGAGQTPGRGSAAAEAAFLAEQLGPWNARNTLLLDDSPLKARLQPYNHLCVPEFDDEGAKRAQRVRERLLDALEAKCSDLSASASASASASTLLSASWEGQDLTPWNQDVELLPSLTGQSSRHEQHDDVLLQLIGVLEEARHRPDVATWIYAGGIRGFGAGLDAGACTTGDGTTATSTPAAAVAAAFDSSAQPLEGQDDQLLPFVSGAEWAARGKATLRALGLPLLF